MIFHWRQISLRLLLELYFMLITWWCIQLCQWTGQPIQIHLQKSSSDCTFQQCDWVKFHSTDFAEIFLSITVLKLGDKLCVWGGWNLNNLWCCLSFLSSPISSSYYVDTRQCFLISWKSTWSQSQHVCTVFGRLRMPLRTADFKWWQVSACSSNAHLQQSGTRLCSQLPALLEATTAAPAGRRKWVSSTLSWPGPALSCTPFLSAVCAKPFLGLGQHLCFSLWISVRFE